jgi:hypothetical protein
LLDIAVILTSDSTLDPIKIAEFLVHKASAREVPVSRSAFRDPKIAMYAEHDYEALEATTKRFIPFDEARQILVQFTDGLPIPE